MMCDKENDYKNINLDLDFSKKDEELSFSMSFRAEFALKSLLGQIAKISEEWWNTWNQKRIGKNFDPDVEKKKNEITLESVEKEEDIKGLIVEQEITKQIDRLYNKKEICKKTIEILKERNLINDPKKLDRIIDQDWLVSYGEFAEKIYSKTRQEQWAYILAREIENPGSFALKTLRILFELDSRTAEIFQSIMKYRIKNECIIKPTELSGDNLTKLQSLVDNDLLHEISVFSPRLYMKTQMRKNESGNLSYFKSGNMMLRVHSSKKAKELWADIILIKQAGREIGKILPEPEHMTILERFAEYVIEDCDSVILYKLSKLNNEEAYEPIKTLK